MYPSLQTELELLQGLALGHHDATLRVYKQHYPVVSHFIRQNGGDEDEAADIFQEAMVVLFEKAQQEDFRLTCKIGTYLFAISKHLWFKRVERKRRQPGLMPENAGADDTNDWAYEEDLSIHEERELHYQQLDAALEQLGEPCSSLLKAFYHHDKSMLEIANDFGYTNPDNAKTQKYKCLNRLKKIFFNAQAR